MQSENDVVDLGMYDRRGFVRRLRESIDNKWPSRQGNDQGQASLSRASGIPQPIVSRILAGKRGLSVDTLLAIADALDVSIDWLLRGSEHTHQPDDVASLTAELRALRDALTTHNQK